MAGKALPAIGLTQTAAQDSLGLGEPSSFIGQTVSHCRVVALNEVIVPPAHLGLVRARVLSGGKVGARQAYQDFLALWRRADAGIPILKQAKSEYAKLSL